MTLTNAKSEAPRSTAHSIWCLPGVLATSGAATIVFAAALKPIESDVNRVLGIDVPWGPVHLVVTVIAALATTFVAITQRFGSPGLSRDRRRVAWFWTIFGLAFATPLLIGIAIFLLIMSVGAMDHFRD